MTSEIAEQETGLEVAIVGMAGRVPGAADVEQFWRNVRDGVESISSFSEEELTGSGVSRELLANPAYVRAGGVLEGAELFDAAFFGLTPREAELMDPQHRVFLECAWEAMESAGYMPQRVKGLVGVYAGSGMNGYLLHNLLGNAELARSVGTFQAVISSDKDYLATQVAYRMGLRGPAVAVQSACSTSLVAIHLACQGLLNGDCDVALAGGVSIKVPLREGYLFQEGGIASPDGHCRPFDARARGTVRGSGAGVVVLKRLEDARADGSFIRAIIRGSAINNDGAQKVGFTAPGIEGQARVISAALTMAEIEPASISYVEAHGTGTALGDPIELAALHQAFGGEDAGSGRCLIGSVKANIGHLDAAAGVAGLIKTVLSLEHQQLAPTPHFQSPNPRLELERGPFAVSAALMPWKTEGPPRRAAVSSFGIGGTNAHVILEEAPTRELASASRRSWKLLPLSARSPEALARATARLGAHLEAHPELPLEDVAYTLQLGRQPFPHRRVLVARETREATAALREQEPGKLLTTHCEQEDRPVAFLFPGQGSQYAGMGRELYAQEPVYRAEVDRCAALLRPHLGMDVRELLHADADAEGTAARRLEQTALTQPALFVVEYALAQLWMSWGVRPKAMLGHSIGEYVAACLAGVFSLEDALALVSARGRLMQALPEGAMLAVSLPEDEARALVAGTRLSLAAINAPSLCVVAGPIPAITALQARLTEQGVTCRRLHTSHAFHSEMMEPACAPFLEQVRRTRLSAPTLPFLSNVSGTWIGAEATDPSYWVSHLRQPVHFAPGLKQLLADPHLLLLEVGPGHTLGTLARQQPGLAGQPVLSSLRPPTQRDPDTQHVLVTLGRLWMAGVAVDWEALHAGEERRRVPLPTYPFERERYWIAPHELRSTRAAEPPETGPAPSPEDGPRRATWVHAPLSSTAAPAKRTEGAWLALVDEDGIGAALVDSLVRAGHEVLRAHSAEDAVRVMREARHRDTPIARVLHLWAIAENSGKARTRGHEDLLLLARALEQEGLEPVRLDLVSSRLHAVTAEEPHDPEKALLLGHCRMIAARHSGSRCRTIDVTIPPPGSARERRLLGQLVSELESSSTGSEVAWRGEQRWARHLEPAGTPHSPTAVLRRGGAYLLTRGLSGPGFALAKQLAQAGARLVLLEPQPLADQADAHDEASERRLQRVRALEALGAQVRVLVGDMADGEQLEQAVTEAYGQLGALHGVIHCAVDEELPTSPASESPEAAMSARLRRELRALFLLEGVLEGRTLDFCLLHAPLPVSLREGEAPFTAAVQPLLDAVAHEGNRSGTPWISVSWNAPEEAQEGAGMLERILALGGAHPLRIEAGTSEALQRAATAPQEQLPGNLHPRPELSSPYAPPTQEHELLIARLWQELLGLAPVGLHDNFFELGGHSLLGTQLAFRLKETFEVDIPLHELFEGPTVAQLALAVEAALIAQLEAAEAAPPHPSP